MSMRDAVLNDDTSSIRNEKCNRFSPLMRTCRPFRCMILIRLNRTCGITGLTALIDNASQIATDEELKYRLDQTFKVLDAMAQDGMSKLDSGEKRPTRDKFIFRYEYLLVEIGTKLIRRLFELNVGHDCPKYLTQTTVLHTLQNLIKAKNITPDQARYLPPFEMKPDSSNFDSRLLTCLLRHVCGLRQPRDTVWMHPSPTDTSEEADIARLRHCRNWFNHRDTVFLTEAEFDVRWKELSGILIRLNRTCGITGLTALIDNASQIATDEELKYRLDQTFKVLDAMAQDGMSKLDSGEKRPTRDLMEQSSSEISTVPPEDPKCFEDQNEDKGRLKKLDTCDVECLLRFCPRKVGSGGFGQVYKSKGKISGLDIDVVLKKILVKDDEDEKKESITNEKLASRTMHFAIVPLLAYGAGDTNEKSERAFYFITPYLENGNLSDAIQKSSNASGSPVLTLTLRMKIMYHIASAIHFLHTPVAKFRGAILHLDIKSSNIVLDQRYNARLIDFGLAREMEEGRHSANTTKVQIPYSKGYCKAIRDGKFDVYADYYNCGVVIRELLTGRKPYGEKKQLKKLNESEVEERLMQLWRKPKPDPEAGKPFPATLKLLELSKQCLEEKDINSQEILNTVQKLVTAGLHTPWHFNGKRCEMCMRYDAVDKTILEHNKECTMRVCVSCMRHSYCNPIVCHTCGEVIIPNIGYGWDAVLIAGNDLENEALAEIFSEDVEKVKKVITSKCPLVMGISEKRVLTVKPNTPGKSNPMIPSLTDRLDTFLSDDPKGKQKTLVLYFSGHYSEKTGFQLPWNEDKSISIEDLLSMEDLLKHLLGTDKKTAGRYERLVLFLDCCCAPSVKVEIFSDIILVQLNACTRNSQSFADKTGSVFQRLFTQALTGRALSSKCMNACKDCGIDNDFVTLTNLQDYIKVHYKNYQYASDLSGPTANCKDAEQKDMRIGYAVNVLVNLEFHFELKGNDEKRNFPHSMFSNIDELRNVLFDEYLEMRPTGQGPPFSRTFFIDILSIFSKLGPKYKHRHELDTIEKVNMAWECRRELYVSLREASKRTGTDLVGVFFEKTSVEPVVDYLFKNGTKTVDDDNTVEFTIRFKEFRNFLKSQIPTLDKVLNVVNGLKDAKVQLKKEQKVDVSNMSVKFPYNETTSPKYRTDFLCFCLKEDKIKG